jgi:hypothetical protein
MTYQFTPWVFRDPSILTPDYATQPAVADRGDTVVDDELAATDLAGYDVEATDGGIGSIDKANYEVGGAYLVVDTGPWIFGRKVLLPAGTVQRVDHADRKVYVDRTKDQIKNAPEYDADAVPTSEYRDRLGGYYTDSYRDSPSNG